MARIEKLLKKMKFALLAGTLAASSGQALLAQETKTVPPGTPVTITVTQAQPASPTVSINLGGRTGKVTPVRTGCTHTGGGIIDVAQPSSDTVVVTMTGAAVAYGGPHQSVAALTFDLDQCFEISFDSPKVKKAKLSLEARLIGLLRSHCKGGMAEASEMCATVTDGPAPPLSIALPSQSVAGGENLSLNLREGACTVPVVAGKFRFHQTFNVAASAPRCLLPGKAPSSEFADGAIDPLWISYKEPFRGAGKKDFGFQVTIKVIDDTESGDDAKPSDNKPSNAKPNGNGNAKPNGNAPVPMPMPTPAPVPMPKPENKKDTAPASLPSAPVIVSPPSLSLPLSLPPISQAK